VVSLDIEPSTTIERFAIGLGVRATVFTPLGEVGLQRSDLVGAQRVVHDQVTVTPVGVDLFLAERSCGHRGPRQ